MTFIHKSTTRPLEERKITFKVGINDAPYQVAYFEYGKRYTCPYYSRWRNMLSRAYNVDVHKQFPTYSECTVSEEWHSFMNFRQWMEEQDWEGKQLDKDLIFPGNTTYGPQYCQFISRTENNQNKKQSIGNEKLHKMVPQYKTTIKPTILNQTQLDMRTKYHYDELTGQFTWRIRPSTHVKVGDRVGGNQQSVNINKKLILIRDVLWMYTYGYYPKDKKEKVFHVNGDVNDFRLSNLKCADAQAPYVEVPLK